MEKLLKASLEGDIDELKRIVNNVPKNEIEDFVNLQKPVTNTTAFHLAARGGFLDICEYLYSYGASLDLTNTDERTPLHFAAMKGFKDICSFLIENGAILDPVDTTLIKFIFYKKIYVTPLQLAINNGFPEIVATLIDYDVKVNPTKRGEIPPILHAIIAVPKAKSKDKVVECIEKLVEHKANVNCSIPDGEFAGETPLISAARLKLPDLVGKLIKFGANVCAVSESGKTAFYYAAINKDFACLESLLKVNPSPKDLERRYENKKSLVHLCVNNFVQGNQAQQVIDMLTLLADHKLNLDLLDDNNDTALHIVAPKAESTEIVKFLIHHGCDPQIVNKKDKTVFSLAHIKIVPVITEALKDEETLKNIEEKNQNRIVEEEELMQTRISNRNEKLAPTEDLSRSIGGKRNVGSNKKQRTTQFLAMTKNNGSLRTPTHASKTQQVKITPNKKTEARPWGGSKQTAVFQRDMRLKLRRVKKGILDELMELRKAVEDVKKRVHVDCGMIDDSNYQSDSNLDLKNDSDDNGDSNSNEESQILGGNQIQQQNAEEVQNHEQIEEQENDQQQQQQHEEQQQQFEEPQQEEEQHEEQSGNHLDDDLNNLIDNIDENDPSFNGTKEEENSLSNQDEGGIIDLGE